MAKNVPNNQISDSRNLMNPEYITHLAYYSKLLKTKDKEILKAAR